MLRFACVRQAFHADNHTPVLSRSHGHPTRNDEGRALAPHGKADETMSPSTAGDSDRECLLFSGLKYGLGRPAAHSGAHKSCLMKYRRRLNGQAQTRTSRASLRKVRYGGAAICHPP